MARAALVQGWNRLNSKRGTSALGTFQPSGSAYAGDANAGNIGVGAEIYLGDQGWMDISPYVYYRDGSTKVSISRGKPDENSQSIPPPQTCSFQLNNRDSRFSPRNPVGPLYGLISRNTQIRFWRMQNGIRRYRYAGEIPEWPTTADVGGNDVYTTVTASGMLRRLQQSNQQIQSAYKRSIVNPLRYGETNVVAYWPLEDASSSTQYASALSGAPAMTVVHNGAVSASNSTWNASKPLPTMNGGVLQGGVPSYTVSGQTNVLLNVVVPAAGVGATRNLITFYTSGTIKKWILQITSAGDLQLNAYDVSNSSVLSTGPLGYAVNGKTGTIDIETTQSGGNINWSLVYADASTYDYATGITTLTQTGAITGKTVGAVLSVSVGDSAGLGSTAIGHVAVGNLINAFLWTALAIAGNANEPVFSPDAFADSGGFYTTGRFLRLCNEQNVNAVEVYGSVYSNDAVQMGPQLPDSFINWLGQCADSDLSLLYEAKDQVSLVMRSRLSLYNQSAGLTLDFAQNQLSAQPVPRDDDYYTNNDVTVSRIGGSSANLIDLTSSLNAQNYPAGVGDYQRSFNLSLFDDSTLFDQAGWRLHMGTVDEIRYPKISVNLRHPTFQNNLDRMNAALTLDIGDVIQLNNPPSWLPPDPIRLVVLGYSETMGAFEHDIVFNCAPESPYEVFISDDPVRGRADTDGSTLTNDLTGFLNADPFFADTSLSKWATSNSSVSSVGTSGSTNPLPAGGPVGYGILLNPSGGSSPNVQQSGATFPVLGLQKIYMSCLIYYPSGARLPQIGITYLNADGSLNGTIINTPTVTAGKWSAAYFPDTVPSTARFAYPYLGINDTPSAGDVVYFACVALWTSSDEMTVTTTNPNSPTWTNTASDFPFDIMVGGERMTVTNVLDPPPATPQRFRVARGVNGVAKYQLAGTDVRLWTPPILGL